MAGYYCITLAVRVNVRLSVGCQSVFSFPDHNLSKCQWSFTKLSVYINIVEIWFGIVNGQISPILDSYLPARNPYFHFRMITSVNINEFSPYLVYVLILWRYALGLLTGKFRQFLTELSARDTSALSFLVNNLSKYQWIFIQLGMCIDIMGICFGIANGRISSIFDSYLPAIQAYFTSRPIT